MGCEIVLLPRLRSVFVGAKEPLLFARLLDRGLSLWLNRGHFLVKKQDMKKKMGTSWSIRPLRRTKPTKDVPNPLQFPTFLTRPFFALTQTPRGRKRNQSSMCGRGSVPMEEIKMLMASAESGVYADDSELELGLTLSTGSGKAKLKAPGNLAMEDFDSVVSPEVSSSSSSSSAIKVDNVVSCGIKRSAESRSSPLARQVVGWPPVRSYRVNTLANQPAAEDLLSKLFVGDKMMMNHCGSGSIGLKEKGGGSCFVKVTMDGVAIGRKMDLNAHSSYKSLAKSVHEMFGLAGSNEEKGQAMRLLDEFVLTYKDRDGDWMLVGDVPWDMFVHSVRRLRIMRRADANGLN